MLRGTPSPTPAGYTSSYNCLLGVNSNKYHQQELHQFVSVRRAYKGIIWMMIANDTVGTATTTTIHPMSSGTDPMMTLKKAYGYITFLSVAVVVVTACECHQKRTS